MPDINEILRDHVTVEVECMDRIYLNGYVPKLQTGGHLVTFMMGRLGKPIPSPSLLGKITQGFVAAVKQFAVDNGISVVEFEHKQRKDDIANELRATRSARDQAVFIGVAQEKAQAFPGRKRDQKGNVGSGYQRDKSVYVNHYYFYIDDEDFGPVFIKVCSYVPWGIKVCINGHEWAKRQLEKAGVTFETLDNGFLSCDDPKKLQEICDSLGPGQIDSFFRNWLGRPDRIALVFGRKITKATPGRFRTRVINEGVHPSLHVEYKKFHLKQYFKEGRALRTEGTFNDPKDFGVNKGLRNLSYLQQLGRNINRRLLDVQRAPGLKFGDPRVMAMFLALTLFTNLVDGFRNRDLRSHVAGLLEREPQSYTAVQMAYDLKRLRLNGLVARPPGTNRYFLTPYGWKVARLFSRLEARVFRPAVTAFTQSPAALPPGLRTALQQVDKQLGDLIRQAAPTRKAA